MKNYSYKNLIFVSDEVHKQPLKNRNNLPSGNKCEKLWVDTCCDENKTVVIKNSYLLRSFFDLSKLKHIIPSGYILLSKLLKISCLIYIAETETV